MVLIGNKTEYMIFTSQNKFQLFSNNRYIAIKSPLKNRVTHRKSKFVILIVWIVSLSLASVMLFVGRVQKVKIGVEKTNKTNKRMFYIPKYDNESEIQELLNDTNLEIFDINQCTENWNPEARKVYTLFSFFVAYLIPVFVLAYTYTCIACIIKSTTHPGNADASRDMQSNKSKRKVIKMLIVLVCTFTLCW